jgi:hypothetical protein
MREAVLRMSPRTKGAIFGVGYVITALWVLFPPLYLAASTDTPRVLGLPFSVFWMILDGVLVLLLVWALWTVEEIRGELEVLDGEETAR